MAESRIGGAGLWGSCEDYIYYFLTYYIGARQQAYMTTPTAGPDRSAHV